MLARRHHYLTQCYLKGFATERRKPRLFVIDISARKTFRTGPENIGAIRDFNRVDLPGIAPDQLEKEYAKFESDVGPALERSVEAAGFATGKDRELILHLLVLIAFRNPRLRAMRDKAAAEISKMMIELTLKTEESYKLQIEHMRAAGLFKDREPLSYADMKALVAPGNYDVKLSQMANIAAEFDAFEKLTPILFARKWNRVLAPAGSPGFVTCDHPVSLYFSDPKQRGRFYPPGFALVGTEVMFPVSKAMALVGVFEGEEREIKADEDLVAALNGATVANAERQIYALDPEFGYLMLPDSPVRAGSILLKDEALLTAWDEARKRAKAGRARAN